MKNAAHLPQVRSRAGHSVMSTLNRVIEVQGALGYSIEAPLEVGQVHHWRTPQQAIDA